jgi:WD40 repeat protein
MAQHCEMYGHSQRVWKVKGVGEELCVSVSEDASCRVWDIENGKQLAFVKGHIGKNVRALAISLDTSNTLIATGGEDSSVKIWSLENLLSQ